ncbi:putative GATA transcription factor 22 [Manihot esculenta]|uniref:GATA-type domain-containing protein n=1 Tax=Manihot esculenta TaxID=3983 RepID=A0A2C9W474_MANES|nr:putative GATA transcription factor 22 [Manihot esculenta]
MTPLYHSPFLIDLNEGQQHDQLFFSKSTEEEAPSSSSYVSILNNPSQEFADYYHRDLQPLIQHQAEANISASHGGSWDYPNENESGFKLSSAVCKEENTNEDQRENSSVKWMSSKMRLMKRMMSSSDQTVSGKPETCMHKFEDDKERSLPLQDDNSSKNFSCSSSNSIRVCADCNTTKTPLWRSGPRGPKSLCNACGIRQRKARRAMAAAAAQTAGASGTIFGSKASAMKTKMKNKERKTSDSHLPLKKRCKFTAQARGRKKLCFEDSPINLSKNSAFHQQVFPQDEKEAAILLMALSYGLVHG